MLTTLNSKYSIPGYESATVEQVPAEQKKAINRALHAGRFPIVLAGTTGAGKTMAAACLYRRIATVMNSRPMWHRCDDLLSGMAFGQISGVQVDGVDDSGQWVRQTVKHSVLVNKITNTECLFLDDFCLEKPKPGMITQMFLLLERRLGKKTVITTNQTGAEIAKLYDDRIRDRLLAGTSVVFKGESRRGTP